MKNNELKHTELYAYHVIREHLQKIVNPTIVEIGMFDGYHTAMLLSWVAGKANYHGFEPDPRNVPRMYMNGLSRRIIFNAAAVGNVTGTVNFNLATEDSSGNAGSSSISEFTPKLTETWSWLKKKDTVQVPCWRLDDYCRQRNIDHIDFLWMDVQGAERLVFDGAQEILKRTALLWTEFDDGTLYADSSNLDDILSRFPGWTVKANCGSDVLLSNPL